MKRFTALLMSAVMMSSAVAFADYDYDTSGEVEVRAEAYVEMDGKKVEGEMRGEMKMDTKKHDAMKAKMKMRMFKDIKGHRYEKGIEMLRMEGVLNGDTPTNEEATETTLRPDDGLNRAEIAKIVVEAKGIAQVKEDCFADVKADDWYAGYVCALKKEGIVKGFPGNEFRPAQKLTVAEGMKIMALVYNGKDNYEEGKDGMDWYEPLMRKALDRNGLPESVRGFNREMTRGEMADALMRLKKYNEGGDKLKEYLGDRYKYRPDFELIKEGRDVIKETFEVYGKYMVSSESNGKVCVMVEGHDKLAVPGYDGEMEMVEFCVRNKMEFMAALEMKKMDMEEGMAMMIFRMRTQGETQTAHFVGFGEMEMMDDDMDHDMDDEEEMMDDSFRNKIVMTNVSTMEGVEGSGYYDKRDGEVRAYASFMIDMPDEGYFYEGWLICDGEVYSSGMLEKDGDMYVNVFSSMEISGNCQSYVLTLEPDDNDPAPAEHLVEGRIEGVAHTEMSMDWDAEVFMDMEEDDMNDDTDYDNGY